PSMNLKPDSTSTGHDSRFQPEISGHLMVCYDIVKLPFPKLIAVIFLLLSLVAVYFWIESHQRAVTIKFPPVSGLPNEGRLVHQADNRETLLALPYTEFDQTKGSGWRPLYDERDQFGEVAMLIEEY